jgi:hypothetical protein
MEGNRRGKTFWLKSHMQTLTKWARYRKWSLVGSSCGTVELLLFQSLVMMKMLLAPGVAFVVT